MVGHPSPGDPLIQMPAMEFAVTLVFVLTSLGKMGDTDRTTEFFLPEIAHPDETASVNPHGGQPPIDAVDVSDPVRNAFAVFGVQWTAHSHIIRSGHVLRSWALAGSPCVSQVLFPTSETRLVWSYGRSHVPEYGGHRCLIEARKTPIVR